jgi:outer membrane beta-barrel protein
MTKRLALGAALTILALPAVAHAEQERKSPLADAPAIRHRLELRDKRFELGAGAGMTLGQDFYHAVMINARLGFHLTDWLAIGAVGGFNLTKNLKTSFHEKVSGALEQHGDAMDRAPSVEEAEGAMNKINQVFAAQLELVPFTGKFSLFSKLFMNYDFYAFGGPGFINFTADQAACDTPKASCPVTGMKVGANFGVGMHAFGNDFFAINIELRDILVRNNPSGRDVDGDGVSDKYDLSWDSNYMLGLNIMFFLPARAAVSD